MTNTINQSQDKPHLIYKKNQGIAKNYKQCRYIHEKINREKSIGYDALFNVNILGKELNCIKWIQSQPFLIVIATDDEICEDVNNLLTEFGLHVLFSYDTTFNIGDFLVSPLLGRHPFLENDIALWLRSFITTRRMK